MSEGGGPGDRDREVGTRLDSKDLHNFKNLNNLKFVVVLYRSLEKRTVKKERKKKRRTYCTCQNEKRIDVIKNVIVPTS